MEVNQATLELRNSLPKEPVYGVDNVVRSMAEVRSKLHAADQRHYEPFALVYHHVTQEVQLGVMSGVISPEFSPFKEPPVLQRATGHFWYHGARQLDTAGAEKHWQPLLEDERARHVDEGTQLWLGMIAHIGGDLARTVYEAEATPTYINHDYPLINRLLEKTAHRVSERFVPVENYKLRRHITNVAMSGIRLGRSYALHDYKKLMKAGTEDQRMSIIEDSHDRTAKLAKAFLSISYKLNHSAAVNSHISTPRRTKKAA